MHSTTDWPAGGNTGRLFLAFGGRSAPTGLAYCPLDRVLTYKNLIYLLNLQFYHNYRYFFTYIFIGFYYDCYKLLTNVYVLL